MVLTAAEKMRRYRQKIKDNPEKYKQQKKKDLQRIKTKRKKISQLDDADKDKIRKQWRDQKKRQRKNKKIKNNSENKDEDIENIDRDGTSFRDNSLNRKNQESDSNLKSKLKYMKKKCYILLKKIEQSKKNEQSLQRIKDRLKKRLYRQKTTSETEIKHLKLTVDKMKAREEILEAALKKTYKNCKNQAEKRVLKGIAENAKVKSFVAKLMGLSGRNKYKKKTTSNGKITEIEKFFIRDDVSRCTAGKKECRSKHKEKRQIRYLLDTLNNLYVKYRSEGGMYKLTTFRKYKPFYVLAPHLASRDTCLCVKHDNVQLKFKALRKSGLIEQRHIKDVLQELACDLKSPLCMHGKCRTCKNKPLNFEPSMDLDKTVTWNQWERKRHEYLKKEGTEKKTSVCIKTEKINNTSTLRELLRIFEADLKLFKKHYFNVHHQQEKYQEGVTHLKQNEALVICDFSQNYESKLSTEVQSRHFGGSKPQISLHTGMIYFKDTSQSFCTVSPSTIHQPQAIWAHLKPVLKYIEEHQTQITVIHFYSDGPTSQYRQKNNFYLLSVFRQKLNLDHSTWSFFESGHGKGVADGIGGTVKRILDRNVCFGRDISNASDAFEVLKDSLCTIKIWYISEEDIDEIAALLPQKLSTVVGTMQLHQIATQQRGTIIYRNLGCFCGSQRGLCPCYEPKIHKFDIPTSENRDIEAADTLDDIESSDLIDVDVEINLEELSAMDDVNFCSIDDLTKPNQTNSALENVYDEFSFIGVSSKPNTSKANSSMMDRNSGKPNISQDDSTMDCLNISYTDSTADNKPNVFKTALANDIQILDQLTTNDEIIVEEITAIERPQISPTHPADYAQTNAVSQADSFKENLSTMRKNPCIVDLTVHPLEMKLTYKPQKRSGSSVLCVSQPKVKKITEEEINAKNYSEPCASKSLRKGTVSITSNMSVNLKFKTEQTRLPKQSKGLKTVVKRAFTCYSCNGPLFSNCITKCISCCNRFCLTCATGEVIKDFICNNCL